MLYTGFCTAERISALLAVRWSDLDLDNCRVTFRAETRKGMTRDIIREITPQLAKMIRARPGVGDELVWHWDRAVKESIWGSLRMLCNRAGVTYRGFHGLRRAAASYMAASHGRAAATALLDHSNPRLLEHYVDPAICPPERTSVDSLPALDLGDRPPSKSTDSPTA